MIKHKRACLHLCPMEELLSNLKAFSVDVVWSRLWSGQSRDSSMWFRTNFPAPAWRPALVSWSKTKFSIYSRYYTQKENTLNLWKVGVQVGVFSVVTVHIVDKWEVPNVSLSSHKNCMRRFAVKTKRKLSRYSCKCLPGRSSPTRFFRTAPS
jgi:hypothetical protein